MAGKDAQPGTRTTDLLPPLPPLLRELAEEAGTHLEESISSLLPEPQDAPPLRWGVLGAGGIAGTFATDVPSLSSGVVCAVGSRDRERAQAFIDAHPTTAKGGPARAYGSYEDLLADPEVEAVYVATPHAFHHAHAVAALQAGKHVLVEKAFTQSAAQAAEVLDLARERGLFAMEAMWSRFLPHQVLLRTLVEAGALGQVRYVRAEHFQSLLHVPRLVRPDLAGGALLDLGVYPMSFIHSLLGVPERQHTSGRLSAAGVDLDELVSMDYASAPGQAGARSPEQEAAYGEGVGARVVAAAGMDAAGANTAEVVGTRARALLGSWFYVPTTLTVTRYGRGGVSGEADTASWDGKVPGGFQFEAAEVARCVAAGRQQSATMPWSATIEVMEMMDRVRADLGVVFPDER